MQINDRHRLERHTRRIEELRLWRNAYESRIGGWSFVAGDGKGYDLEPGDFWPEIGIPVRLSALATVPEEWAGLPVELELWLGGEGFVEISVGEERSAGGINPFHRSFPVLEKSRGGEEVGIEAEVVSKGMFGSNVAEPRLERACLAVPETEVRALERDLTAVFETCAALDDHEVVPRVARRARRRDRRSLHGLADGDRRHPHPLPRGLREPGRGTWRDSLPPNYAEKPIEFTRHLGEPWSLPRAPLTVGPLAEDAREAVREAREIVAGLLEADQGGLSAGRAARAHRARAHGSRVALAGGGDAAQGAAHLRQRARPDGPLRGLRLQPVLGPGLPLDRGGRPALCSSGSRSASPKDRWEPVGGSWVEPDCQIPSRRVLRRASSSTASATSRRPSAAAAPSPGSRTSSASRPESRSSCAARGSAGFFTIKLNWNETNDFPARPLRVGGHRRQPRPGPHLREPGDTATTATSSRSTCYGTWSNFRGKRLHPESLLAFGWGDGGGGPSERMLENYARLKDFPAMPRLRMARVDDFFAALPEDGLPRWVGELYLELHRGTLTTQARVKKLNRAAEHRLLEAEAFATLAAAVAAASYPAEELERPGRRCSSTSSTTSCPAARSPRSTEDTHRDLEDAVATAETLRDRALASWHGGGGPANASRRGPTPALHPGRLPPSCRIRRPARSSPPTATASHPGDRRRAPGPRPGRTVAGLGWTSLEVARGDPGRRTAGDVRASRVEESGGSVSSRTSFFASRSAPTARLHGVYDKEADREVLDGRGNQLLAYADKPANWDAWDVDESLRGRRRGGLPVPRAWRWWRAGRCARRCASSGVWRGSRISQTYVCSPARGASTSRRACEWHERQMLLRALLPSARSAPTRPPSRRCTASCSRPTHRNTCWDAARFEVCAHRFADLSEPGYGVALLNDGKYGHSVHDNVLGLSLLRGPLYPDPLADEGEHRFTYSLFPHAGDWTEAGVAAGSVRAQQPARRRRRAGRSQPSTGSSTAEASSLRSGRSSRPKTATA